ncbi:glutathione peroxidase [Flagellimonas eckloniae]|uniref:Glutathione peroxidase n=1 Tax=Flagellimonas eckloniae TaxID=346185 RepID=A0A0Q0XCT0_9FLAO|nr:glutathione peroxidase [Allomuricauda eckloniae]KQC28943.1 glutathione peroxidase [Allomuricauda eckloniae]
MRIVEKAKLAPSASKDVKINSLYDININTLGGIPIRLSQYKGKHILFVNVASECGFTKQYKELQALSDRYKEELVVIGLPCNQFGKQEPGDASQIQEFCELNFGVTFLLTEKIHVKGSKQHPLYKWLTSKDLNSKKSSSVKWNFQKYLVDEKGNLIDYYFSITKPMSPKITRHL